MDQKALGWILRFFTVTLRLEEYFAKTTLVFMETIHVCTSAQFACLDRFRKQIILNDDYFQFVRLIPFLPFLIVLRVRYSRSSLAQDLDQQEQRIMNCEII
jgi:hypothetical protein